MSEPTAAVFQAVFADADGTIMQGRSLLGFLEQLEREAEPAERERLHALKLRLLDGLRSDLSRVTLNETYYREVLTGRRVEDVQRAAASWYAQASLAADFTRPAVVRFLKRRRAAGSRLVLVSGSFEALLVPLLEQLGGGDVLAAPLEVLDGRYSGRLLGPPMLGAAKVVAVRAYAARWGLSLGACAAIGDDASDRGFLELVGAPYVPAQASGEVLEYARRARWQVLGDAA